MSFVLIEQRHAHLLLPLHIIRDRARGGAYASIVLSGAGGFGVFLVLTYFMQQNRGFSPLSTVLAFLPMTAVIVVSSTTAQTQLLPRIGAKPLIITGMTLGLIAMLLLTRLTPRSSYAGDVLPSLLILGLGMGMITAPAFSTATLGVDPTEAGAASAMVNTSQQVGGSVGTALLSTLFASSAAAVTRSHPTTHGLQAAAMVHGYTTTFWWASGIFAVGLLTAVIVFPARVKAVPPILDPSPATG